MAEVENNTILKKNFHINKVNFLKRQIAVIISTCQSVFLPTYLSPSIYQLINHSLPHTISPKMTNVHAQWIAVTHWAKPQNISLYQGHSNNKISRAGSANRWLLTLRGNFNQPTLFPSFDYACASRSSFGCRQKWGICFSLCSLTFCFLPSVFKHY